MISSFAFESNRRRPESRPTFLSNPGPFELSAVRSAARKSRIHAMVEHPVDEPNLAEIGRLQAAMLLVRIPLSSNFVRQLGDGIRRGKIRFRTMARMILYGDDHDSVLLKSKTQKDETSTNPFRTDVSLLSGAGNRFRRPDDPKFRRADGERVT